MASKWVYLKSYFGMIMYLLFTKIQMYYNSNRNNVYGYLGIGGSLEKEYEDDFMYCSDSPKY